MRISQVAIFSLLFICFVSSASEAQQRDPFAPAGNAVKVMQGAVKDKGNNTEISPNSALKPQTAYKLTSYKVVGIIKSSKKSMVAVKALNGIDYIMQKGEMLGSDGGKITKITRDGIIIKNSEGEVKLHVSNKIEVSLEKSQK